MLWTVMRTLWKIRHLTRIQVEVRPDVQAIFKDDPVLIEVVTMSQKGCK